MLFNDIDGFTFTTIHYMLPFKDDFDYFVRVFVYNQRYITPMYS